MKYLSEIEAENFLEKQNFPVVERMFCKKKSDLKNCLEKLGFDVVMKVAGKNIIHKNKINGVETEISYYSEALRKFERLRKIKKSEGVLIQKKLQGKEFFIGIKSTPEFGQVIAFGEGGIKVEEKKDIAFRVPPLNRSEIKRMIKSTKASFALLKNDGKAIENIILRISQLTGNFPQISELDINPLIVQDGKATIVDARIVFQ